MLKNAWRVPARQKEVQQQSSTEDSRAEGDPIKIDLRVQGVPQNAVLEDQGRVTKIQDLVQTPRTQSWTESVIADLKKTGDFNTFSEESKKDDPKPKKDRTVWIGRSLCGNAVPHRVRSIGQKDCYIALAVNV